MNIIIIPPRPPYTGNLIWDKVDGQMYSRETEKSVSELVALGYWASFYPEGDGVTFTDSTGKDDTQMIDEFKAAFSWATVIPRQPENEDQPKRSPMPTLGYEENSKLEKSQIALAQLEDAISMYLAGRTLSAITLAGAADGVFSGLLNQEGKLSPAQEAWKGIEEARKATGLSIGGDRKEKDAHWEWNEWRNRLKHHSEKSEKTVQFNVFDQAYFGIERAIAAAGALGLEPLNGHEYEAWNMKNIFGIE